IDTLWFAAGQEPDGYGGYRPINGGVYKSFAKDQTTNLMIALPQTRAGTVIGGGYSMLSQGAGNLADWRRGKSLRGYDPGKLQETLLANERLVGPRLATLEVGQRRIAVLDTQTGRIHYGVSSGGRHFDLVEGLGLPATAEGRFVGGFIEAEANGRVIFIHESG